MTCVVGLRFRDVVVLGADSAGVSGNSLIVRRDPKVFARGPYLIGFTWSFRAGQVLQYLADLPPPPARGLERHMAGPFVDAVRKALKDAGWASKEQESERGGIFLVASRGRLFDVDRDYQVGESVDPFAAVGAGAPYALGALHAIHRSAPPTRACLRALAAAERHCSDVRRPFRVVCART